MVRFLFFIPLFFYVHFAYSAHHSNESFAEYLEKYSHPQLFENNRDSLEARIRILENAPPESEVKVATFVFDSGESTRRLAHHLCKAASPIGGRMKVTLLANSNTGCRPGVEDCFDKSDIAQMNEEIYQYLANCGVKVLIHNFIPDDFFFVGLLSKTRYPVLMDTKDPGFLAVGLNYNKVFRRFKKSFNRHFTQVPGIGNLGTVDVTLPFNLRDLLTSSLKFYRGRDMDIWKHLEESMIGLADPDEIKKRLPAFVKEITQTDPVLSEAFKRIQVLNRINHRKLFWVKAPDDGPACFFMGGRNLGDHYLNWKKRGDQFIDGDVLYCSHHTKEGVQDPVQQASESFDDLYHNTKDPVMDNIIYEIKENRDFVFELLSLEDAPFYAPQLIQDPRDSEELSDGERTIPKIPADWNPSQPKMGIPLTRGTQFHVRLSSWDPTRDEVRFDLLQAINREEELIYIETAYAEFNEEIRVGLEKALARGVRVHIVSNSLLLLDGPSKVIRLTQASWIKKMTDLYGASQQFIYQVSTVHGGHMIHFKGFGFRRQNVDGQFLKFFGVGSHNFHPRSGRFDKEHAIHWYEQISPEKDFIDIRMAYYSALTEKFKKRLQGQSFLKSFPSLYLELSSELDYLQKIQSPLHTMGSSFIQSFFDEEGHLKGEENGTAMVEALRESGLQDLFGLFL